MMEHRVQCKLMGSAFELLLIHPDKVRARHLLEIGIDEIRRIEKLLSEFLPASETYRINHHHGKEPLQIDQECFDLVERCLHISKLTRGCFDISVGPLKKLYSFKNDLFEFPSPGLIHDTLKSVGYSNIELDRERRTILFKRPGMRISFAAIGKGYASDRVKSLWQENGLKSGYINASGDLNAFGSRPDGRSWKIGIANPDDKNRVLFYTPLSNASAATSGDYEQFFIHHGKRFSHNINPHTGLPLTGIKSVTVFSPRAELSDALATAIYVMGKKDGIAFANQLPHTHCIIIDDQNKTYFSKNLKYEESYPQDHGLPALSVLPAVLHQSETL